MTLPFEYDHARPLAVRRHAARRPPTFDGLGAVDPARAARPHDVVRAGHAQRAARDSRRLVAHGAVGRGDWAPTSTSIGIFTLPEMELPFATMEVIAEIRRVAGEVLDAGKFPVVLGGEHSITPPVVAAVAARHPGLSVLQIDAHADLRDRYHGQRHNHACAMRRVLEYARGSRRSASAACPARKPRRCRRSRRTIFYDCNMREDPNWIDRVVDSLRDTVYITIDFDGLDPGSCRRSARPSRAGCRGTRC